MNKRDPNIEPCETPEKNIFPNTVRWPNLGSLRSILKVTLY